MPWTRREQAICERDADRQDRLIHHSDRGVQYLAIRYTERLAEAGIEPSVGSKGDSYDNALAESVIGLFKAEVIRQRGPWRSLEDAQGSLYSSGCGGSTTGASWNHSAIFHQPSTRRLSTAAARIKSLTRYSTNRVSE